MADFRDESKVLDNATFDKIIYLRYARASLPSLCKEKGEWEQAFAATIS